MKAIEAETVIPPDGQLPPSFREAFGRKVRVIVLFEEDEEAGDDGERQQQEEHSARLMDLASKIKAFRQIENPVAYQRQMRDEWTHRLSDA